MFTKLESIERRFEEIERELSSPEAFDNQDRYRELAKTHAELGSIVTLFCEYRDALTTLDDAQEMLEDSDAQIREMAKAEQAAVKKQLAELEQELTLLLLPSDPLDEKNSILEIRAGTGGEEAALFAADLFRMYTRFAEKNGWKLEVLSLSETGSGGLKEGIVSVAGNRVYSRLKYESGIHRVQRVPLTESQGRIHTSAVTVAILPEAEEVELHINTEDLRIDVFRASGPGGQSVNTTDSAIRITHIPTGLTVVCQDEKSQHKNKAKALKVLRSRLFQMEQDRVQQEQADARREQVGSGDRSGRIRTYNFPQGRVTDHRINLTLYRLDEILSGDLAEIIDGLVNHYQALLLKEQTQE